MWGAFRLAAIAFHVLSLEALGVPALNMLVTYEQEEER